VSAAVRFVQVMAVCRMDGWMLFRLWAASEIGTEEQRLRRTVIAGLQPTARLVGFRTAKSARFRPVHVIVLV
jgi:hypothetical protein